ncbi:helix-turn-helix domain-containing protein [Streptomyces sp. NPDC087428]|uniref:helix-turn-helix domain-containing protein n=1 Tax=Streptomyces sp. NPDC087428 TaxID=3365788 RepID=UPI003810E0D4
MTQQEWAHRVAAVVAGEVRRYREMRGLSAQQLADACAKQGMPIQRSVIANFENGRRTSIGVAELLMFAAVLEVPPVVLLFPVGYETSTEYLPNESADPYMAAMWASGENAPVDHEDNYSATPLALGRYLVLSCQAILETHAQLEIAGQQAAEEGEGLRRIEAEYETSVHEYHKASHQMEAARRDGAPAGPEDFARLSAAYNNMQRLLDLKHRAGASKYRLKDLQEELEANEVDARDIIKEIRANGWKVPAVGADLEYLLKEPESAVDRAKNLRAHRVRKAPKGN